MLTQVREQRAGDGHLPVRRVHEGDVVAGLRQAHPKSRVLLKSQ